MKIMKNNNDFSWVTDRSDSINQERLTPPNEMKSKFRKAKGLIKRYVKNDVEEEILDQILSILDQLETECVDMLETYSDGAY